MTGGLSESHLKTLQSLQVALSFEYSILIDGRYLIANLCKLAAIYGTMDDEAILGVSMPVGWLAVSGDLVELGLVVDLIPQEKSLHLEGDKLHQLFIKYEKRQLSETPASYLFGYLVWRLFIEALDADGRAKSTLKRHATDLWLALERFNNMKDDARSAVIRALSKEVGNKGPGYVDSIITALNSYVVKKSPYYEKELEFANSIKRTIFFKSPSAKGGVGPLKKRGHGGQLPSPEIVKKKSKNKSRHKEGRSSSRRLTNRSLRVTVNSYGMWNVIEKDRFIKALGNAVDEAGCFSELDLHCWALIAASFYYGKPISHWFDRPFGVVDSMDLQGNYMCAVYLPPDRQEITDNENWKEPIKHFKLEPDEKLRSIISRVNVGDGSSIGEVLNLSIEMVRSRARTLLSSCRDEGRYDINLGAIARQRELHINIITESALLTYLLISDKDVVPPVGIYYQSISVGYLKEVWGLSTKYLLDASCAGDPLVYREEFRDLDQRGGSVCQGYTGYHLDELTLNKLVGSLTKKTISVLQSSATYIEKHNAYADYIVVILHFGLGARPVLDPFPLRRWFNCRDKIALLQDKYNGGDPSYRASSLADILCEQLGYYDRHLEAFAAKLFNSGRGLRNLAKCIFGLANSDTPPQNIPYLFRLDSDGLNVIKYGKGDFSRIIGAVVDMPDNYPRKFFYMECFRAGVPDTVIRSLVGHATSKANLLGSDSIHSLSSEISKVGHVIDCALKRVGFEAIKGLRSYAMPDFQKVCPSEITDFIPKRELLGYEIRNRESYKIKLKAKEYLNVVERIIEVRYGLSVEALDSYKNYDKKTFRLVKFILKTEIKSSVGSRNKRIASRAYKIFQQKIKSASKVNPVLRKYADKVNNYNERIPLSEKKFIGYCEASSLRCGLINYFNTEDLHKSTEMHRAELVLAAALFSYIADAEVLQAISTVDLSDSYYLDGALFVDLASLDPNRPRFRWGCDKLSSLIIARNIKTDVSDGSATYHEGDLRVLMDHLGVSYGKSSGIYKKLSELASSLALFDLGGAWYRGQVNSAAVQSLSKKSFFSYMQNAIPHNLESIRETSDVAEFIVESDKDRNRMFDGLKVIEGCFSTIEYTGPTNNRREKAVARDNLGYALSAAFDARNGWDSATELLCLWLQNITKFGTVDQTNPAISTLKTYFSLISKSIVQAADGADFRNISSAECSRIYHAAYGKRRVKRMNDFWSQVEQFHIFINKNFGAEPVVFESYKNYNSELSCRANYVSIPSYRYAISYILKIDQSSVDKKFCIAGLLFFGRRFGMRISEILKLRFKDILFDPLRRVLFVRLRDGVKSKSSRRHIPLAGDLMEDEVEIIMALLDRCELRVRPNEPNPILLADLDRNLVNDCTDDCQELIKKTTDDESSSHHDLRHSWATDVVNMAVSDVLQAGVAQENSKFKSGFSGSSYRSLINISNLIGHSDCSTIVGTYYNTRELFLKRWYCFDDYPLLSLKGVGNLSGLKYHALAKRMRRANSGSKNALSIVGPEDWSFIPPVTVIPLNIVLEEAIDQAPIKPDMLTMVEWVIETDFSGMKAVANRLSANECSEYEKVISRCNFIQNCVGHEFFTLIDSRPDRPTQNSKSRLWLRKAMDSLVRDNDVTSEMNQCLIRRGAEIWFAGFHANKPKVILFNDINECREFSEAWKLLRPASIFLKVCYSEHYTDRAEDFRGYEFQRISESSEIAQKKGVMKKLVWVTFEGYDRRPFNALCMNSYFAMIHTLFR
ncbi:site-specific integrase [Zhongshania borealis]|uniref:Tyr recombinase domain-containing protein n=1 Tax=Zhongshania borealis TaxID=889488 RepID=A0ABP7WQW8_9GAMM